MTPIDPNFQSDYVCLKRDNFCNRMSISRHCGILYILHRLDPAMVIPCAICDGLAPEPGYCGCGGTCTVSAAIVHFKREIEVLNGTVGPAIAVLMVSDPPTQSAADLARIRQESRQLHDAFTERTAGMETLTADDLKIRTKGDR